MTGTEKIKRWYESDGVTKAVISCVVCIGTMTCSGKFAAEWLLFS